MYGYDDDYEPGYGGGFGRSYERGYRPAFEGPYGPFEADDFERLRLVAYVDGRLVETWTAPVQHSRWAEVARRIDEARRPAPEPAPPRHQQVLAWLDGLCGDREALLSLTADPLTDEPDLPEVETAQARARLSAVAELLDALASRCLTPEIGAAMRVCLLEVWSREPEVIFEAASAAHAAGAVAWAVTKANGLLGPKGMVTVTRMKDALALRATPSAYGRVVERALVGYRDLGHSYGGRAFDLPELLPLGHPGLLVAETRRTLIRARDRALEAQEASAA